MEMVRTGTDHVYLDLSLLHPELIKQRFPNIYETCLCYGLNISKTPIPVAPAAHYMMGGVATDLNGRTGLPHLFACGEVANSGVHGANRLASNSLLDGLVFGHRILTYLQKHPLSFRQIPSKLQAAFSAETNPAQVAIDRLKLQQLASTELAIIRQEDGLYQAEQFLKETELQQVPALTPDYLELQNLRLFARLLVAAARDRLESRGSHYRLDYPEPNPVWAKRIIQSPQGKSTIPVEQPFSWRW
jgi:L-aspartate oxidase